VGSPTTLGLSRKLRSLLLLLLLVVVLALLLLVVLVLPLLLLLVLLLEEQEGEEDSSVEGACSCPVPRGSRKELPALESALPRSLALVPFSCA
jgi:hypothetical protein